MLYGFTDDWHIGWMSTSEYNRDIQVAVFKDLPDGSILVVTPDYKTRTVPPGGNISDGPPTFKFTTGMMQSLANFFYKQFRIKPEDRDFKNEMALLKNHLADMRHLVGLPAKKEADHVRT